jgi:8-oxo-dGTP pyrophosphatase MutT (NUDIX family)
MVFCVKSLEQIRRRFEGHEPSLLSVSGKSQAAVAILLRERDIGPEVLFIERATRHGDPWSGHMAFPGGRVDPEDAHPQGAAERETLEEVGISLSGAEVLGQLDDLRGRHAASPDHAMVISAFVYRVADPGPLNPNWEVADAFWFSLAGLVDSAHHVDYPTPHRRMIYPGIRVGEADGHIVWGLTYRFIEVFFQVVGCPLPNRWENPAALG